MLVSSKVHSGKFPFASIKILSSIIMLKREKSLPRISSSIKKVFSKLILADVYVNEGFNVSHIYDNFQFNYGSPATHTIFFLLSLVNDWCALRWLLYFHTCSRFYLIKIIMWKKKWKGKNYSFNVFFLVVIYVRQLKNIFDNLFQYHL